MMCITLFVSWQCVAYFYATLQRIVWHVIEGAEVLTCSVQHFASHFKMNV